MCQRLSSGWLISIVGVILMFGVAMLADGAVRAGDSGRTGWKIFIVAFCTLFVAISALELWLSFPQLIVASRASFQTTASFVETIVDVRPGGWAQLAGLRVGDRLELRHLSPADRWTVMTNRVTVGKVIVLEVAHGRDHRSVGIDAARPITPTMDVRLLYLGLAAFWWFLLFAAFIGIRCADNAPARLLCLIIAFIPAAIILAPQNFVTPWPYLNIVGAEFGNVLDLLAYVLFIAFTHRFAQPASATRQVLS